MTLFEWMARTNTTNRSLAGCLGVSEEFIRLLRHGQRCCAPLHARRIARITKGEVTVADINTASAPPARKPKPRKDSHA